MKVQQSEYSSNFAFAKKRCWCVSSDFELGILCVGRRSARPYSLWWSLQEYWPSLLFVGCVTLVVERSFPVARFVLNRRFADTADSLPQFDLSYWYIGIHSSWSVCLHLASWPWRYFHHAGTSIRECDGSNLAFFLHKFLLLPDCRGRQCSFSCKIHHWILIF